MSLEKNIPRARKSTQNFMKYLICDYLLNQVLRDQFHLNILMGYLNHSESSYAH